MGMRTEEEEEEESGKIDELAGLEELIIRYGRACREETAVAAVSGNAPSVIDAARAKTDALAKRIRRRVRRLELLATMGGIEPSDVRGALIGTWRI